MLTKISKFYRSPLFKALQTIAVIAFGIFAVYRWHPILLDSLPIMVSIPIWGILLLFASQLFMYYCNAQLLYLPLRHRYPIGTLWRTAIELNFINTAIPYGEGLGFLWIQRLGAERTARKELRYVFILRYAVSILTNNLLSLLAMFWMRSQGNVKPHTYSRHPHQSRIHSRLCHCYGGHLPVALPATQRHDTTISNLGSNLFHCRRRFLLGYRRQSRASRILPGHLYRHRSRRHHWRTFTLTGRHRTLRSPHDRRAQHAQGRFASRHRLHARRSHLGISADAANWLLYGPLFLPVRRKSFNSRCTGAPAKRQKQR